jgi:hypothetical protein
MSAGRLVTEKRNVGEGRGGGGGETGRVENKKQFAWPPGPC